MSGRFEVGYGDQLKVVLPDVCDFDKGPCSECFRDPVVHVSWQVPFCMELDPLSSCYLTS